MFVRGNDNALWQKSWNGTSWSTWMRRGGTLGGGPDATSPVGGRIDVYAPSTAGALLHTFFDGTWRAFETLAPPTTGAGAGMVGDPSAVSWGPGRIGLFVRARDNSLWHKWA